MLQDPKAQKEANLELIRVAVAYGALLERFDRETEMFGKPSDEARAMKKEVDRRWERIHK